MNKFFLEQFLFPDTNTWESPIIWILYNIFLNNMWDKEEISGEIKHFELNKKVNTTY